MSLNATYKNAAAKFAHYEALDEELRKKRANKLAPLSRDFVKAAEYIAEHWNTYETSFDAKSGMKKPEARRKWLCAAIGIKAEPCKDWFSRVKTVGQNAERALKLLDEGVKIHNAEYFARKCRKKSGASHATDHADSGDDEAEVAADTEAEVAADTSEPVVDPAARLAKLAAEFFDYGLKHGYDEDTLFTMLEAAAPSASNDLAVAV